MTRALIGAVLMSLTACGGVHSDFASASSYVPWRPLPAAHQYVDTPTATPVSAPAVSAATQPCRGGQLEGVSVGEGIGMGNTDIPLLLRNRSAVGCYLQGYPSSISVLDAGGQSLARSSGIDGRGSYFDPGYSQGETFPKVLLLPSTAALPAQGSHTNGAVGQAYENFSWYDCRQIAASSLRIDLVGGLGGFDIPFSVRAATNPYCQGAADRYSAAMRGYFNAAGISWAPSLRPVALDVAIAAPAKIKAGSSVTYSVTLRNGDERTYEMQPCADYVQYVGKSQLASTFQLNCGPVGRLAAGSSATFEMRVDVPSSATRGASQLDWCLNDGRIGNGCALADVTVS